MAFYCFTKVYSTDASDLFWAVRGGGGAFAVLTSITFRLHTPPQALSISSSPGSGQWSRNSSNTSMMFSIPCHHIGVVRYSFRTQRIPDPGEGCCHHLNAALWAPTLSNVPRYPGSRVLQAGPGTILCNGPTPDILHLYQDNQRLHRIQD